MVKLTSRNAFDALMASGSLQPLQRRVLQAFQFGGNYLTRQQIAENTGLPLNTVCGRVNALLHPSVALLKVHSIDKSSGRAREVLTLNFMEVEEDDGA